MAGFGIQGVLQRTDGLHRRMAGACGRAVAVPGSRRTAGDRRQRAARVAERGHAWGRGLAGALAAALLLGDLAAAQAQVIATRIWPARDYTRVTFESREPLDYSLFALKNPERLVLDLNAEDAAGLVAELQSKVGDRDHCI